ncbi:MAG: M36 family metallopeptidase [Kofleriaceae bacterium]
MLRTNCLLAATLSLAAACSSTPSAPPPSVAQPTPTEQKAVEMGVSIDSVDKGGAPRLLRSIVPRRPSLAGMTPEQAAHDHVSALSSLWVPSGGAATLTNKGTQRLRNGSSVVKLAQQVDGVDVHQGELRVLLNADGSLSAVSGTLLPVDGKAKFQSKPSQALDRTLDVIYGKQRAVAAISEGAARGGWQELTVAASPGRNVTKTRAKRELFNTGKGLVPAWSVEVFGDNPSPKSYRADQMMLARRYVIADDDGRVLSETNLIHSDANYSDWRRFGDTYHYRAYADNGGNRRPFDGAMRSFAPHPTGQPDGSLPGFARSNLVSMKGFNEHGDPWLTRDATTTAGNNVEAFADLVPPAGFNEGDIRPDVRNRTFNFRYDHNADPLATPEQSKAAVVNSFFVTNWLHDWWYDSGFTEATGNAQLDNYGRGGVDGDRMILFAQDGALSGSRDNAFMVTPADGVSPEMHMFLWSAPTETSMTTPAGELNTSFLTTGPKTFDITGELVAAQDGVGDEADGCEPITNDVAGKIVLVAGNLNCAPATPQENAKAAGATAVVFIFPFPGAPAGSIPGSVDATLPGLSVSFEDGQALRAQVASAPLTVTLHRLTSTVERDGDLDNAIVAHEWGHYLHLRLASCSTGLQCFGMSEGWGDFSALFMMLRREDDRRGTYAPGLYALAGGALAGFGFEDPGYFGIRRYPYSRNQAKNPLSFRHIGDENELPTNASVNGGPVGNPNSEVHNTGEVWASMLWDVYNALIDAHGFRVAQRRMSDYVVAGLLMTPPEATFTEGRDAILAAVQALDSDDALLIARAFARRGAGSCAAAPDRGSATNAGVVESNLVAANVKTSGLSLVDDGASCDHDGYLDPGESGLLHITVSNGGIVAAQNVKVTATTATPGVMLGAPISMGTLAPLSAVELTIPVSLAADAPLNADLAIGLSVTSNAGCGSNVTATLRAPIGVDEAAQVAKLDRVETQLTAWTRTGDGASALWARAAESSGNHLWRGEDAGFIADTQLTSPPLQASATEPLVVKISHAYELEAVPAFGIFFDGGVIEFSTDSGATWADIATIGLDPGYDGLLAAGGGNALEDRPAFSGTSAGFPERSTLTLDFGDRFAGQTVQLRFRVASDIFVGAAGWFIDDLDVSGIDNTPFADFIEEPSTCSLATAAAKVQAGIGEVRVAPRASLAAFDRRDLLDEDPQQAPQ